MRANLYSCRTNSKDKSMNESIIQQQLLSYCAILEREIPELSAIYSIPNEGKRSGYEGAKMKRMGLRKGIPDLCLPVRSSCGSYGSLYLEMKTPSGKVREEQKRMIKLLRWCGNRVEVARSADFAMDLILEHLGIHSDIYKPYLSLIRKI